MSDSARKKAGAIIVAAGSSQRMEGVDKVFTPLGGRSVLARVVDTFQNCDSVSSIVIVLSAENLDKGKKLVEEESWDKAGTVCQGGARRQDSVAAGLKCIDGVQWVVIHDGARPLVTTELIENGLDAAEETGAAIAAVPVTDTIKVTGDDMIVQGTPPRQNLWAVQTPQVFRYDLITEAYGKLKYEVTDDARAVEHAGGKVRVYMGSYNNIKITTPDDLHLAEYLLTEKK